MLHGRDRLFELLPADERANWVDLGAGTGRNAERFGERLANFSAVTQVDLSTSLLKVADRRIAEHGWTHVRTVHADATRYDVPANSVDLVTCCYSLTMIPDWFAAVDNAHRMLKPGGTLGVVDFYVSRKHPAEGHRRHNWFTRTFWPTWFAMDNVFASPDHLPLLASRFEPQLIEERAGRIPWLPIIRAPHYIFVGRKSQTPDS